MKALPKIYSQLQLNTPLLNVCVSIVHYDQIYSDGINEPFKSFVGELYEDIDLVRTQNFPKN